MKSLATIQSSKNESILMPTLPNKDESSRIGAFVRWLDMQGVNWHNADLEAYRDHLLTNGMTPAPDGNRKHTALAPATVKAHLATIRGRYNALMTKNTVRDSIYATTPSDLAPADRKAVVDETLTRLQNAVHPNAAKVEIITKQDSAESEHLRLKPHEVDALLKLPGIDSLTGLRDTAMIALTVCTGIREAELCNLDVEDLRQKLGGELALRIRDGKGGKQRLVPYGALDWCLPFVERWLEVAGIKSGAVFRGFYHGGKVVRPGRISTRSVNEMFNKYEISVDGVCRDVKPHDLRRTYARNAYERGMDIVRIQQNLGHANLQTTLGYIGELNAEQRRPPAMFEAPYNMKELNKRWTV